LQGGCKPVQGGCNALRGCTPVREGMQFSVRKGCNPLHPNRYLTVMNRQRYIPEQSRGLVWTAPRT